MSSNDQNGGVAQMIMSVGEEKMGEVLSQLLANETFVRALQTAVTSSLSAKISVDKNLARVLGLANIPTLEDVDGVRDKMEDLEESLYALSGVLSGLTAKVDALAEAKSAESAPKKAPAKKKKATAKKKSQAKKGTSAKKS